MQWKGNAMNVVKKCVSSQLAVINAARVQVMTLALGPPEEVDYIAVGAAAVNITTSLTDISKDVKVIAALIYNHLQRDILLSAARNFCAEFHDLLKAAKPETKQPRQNLLNAAEKVGEVSHSVLMTINKLDAIDKEIQDDKTVSTALKNYASCFPEQKDMKDAIKKITNASKVLNAKEEKSQIIQKLRNLRQCFFSIFVDYKTRVEASVNEIARLAQEMVVKSSEDSSQLGPLTTKLADQFSYVASDICGVVFSNSYTEMADRLKSSVQDLGTACIGLTRAAGSCQCNPNDKRSQRYVSDNARTVTEKVSFVLSELQAGTQACINAARTVSGIIDDLETTIMSATAGILNAENENETFGNHIENILKTVMAFAEDTKTLIKGATSQEQLVVAARNAVTNLIQLAAVVKCGAAALGSNNSEAQVLLINAVKDVATAFRDLVRAIKAVSGKSIPNTALTNVKDSAEIFVTNVRSLLKTVKSIKDAHSRGTCSLDSTTEPNGQEIKVTQKATAEDKSQLVTESRTIGQSIQDVSCAEELKDCEDPEAPMVNAETELFGAANSIHAAVKTLSSLKPLISKHRETDETMSFEVILDDAKSIVHATSSLVKVASYAQRELVASGKLLQAGNAVKRATDNFVRAAQKAIEHDDE